MRRNSPALWDVAEQLQCPHSDPVDLSTMLQLGSLTLLEHLIRLRPERCAILCVCMYVCMDAYNAEYSCWPLLEYLISYVHGGVISCVCVCMCVWCGELLVDLTLQLKCFLFSSLV